MNLPEVHLIIGPGLQRCTNYADEMIETIVKKGTILSSKIFMLDEKHPRFPEVPNNQDPGN